MIETLFAVLALPNQKAFFLTFRGFVVGGGGVGVLPLLFLEGVVVVVVVVVVVCGWEGNDTVFKIPVFHDLFNKVINWS